MRSLRVPGTVLVLLAPIPLVAQNGDRLGTRAEMASMEDAFYANGRWYVADEKAHRVHVLDQRGALIMTFGKPGRWPGEFNAPSAVAVTASHVYVADRGRNAVSEFTLDGKFTRFLTAPANCGRGSVAGMATGGGTLFVLRRCNELPTRIRYQVERPNGSRLEVWNALGDTLHVAPGSAVPIHFPLIAASDSLVALGEGGRGCVRFADRRSGGARGTRCFTEIRRRLVPDSVRRALSARWEGHVSVPDSLPRLRRLHFFGDGFAVYAVESLDRASWTLLPFAASRARPRGIGRARVEHSFLAPGLQLVGTARDSGMRVEVLPWK